MPCTKLFFFGLFNRDVFLFNPVGHQLHFIGAIGIEDQGADMAQHAD